jgi:hypothetical protein
MSSSDDPFRRDGEPFVARWSRLKGEAQQPAPEPPAVKGEDAKEPAPDLPPVDQLTPESDFRAFFHPKVGETMRRAALKKLFSDPHFNVMDGLDVYIDDYSKTEPIPAAMLATLKQAQNILGWAKEDEDKRGQDELAQEKFAQAAPGQVVEPPAAPSVPGAAPQTDEVMPEAMPAASVAADEPPKP